MPPRISVIMLTYNRENLVEQMITDIINQTFEDFEFIIVDNGSTDSSGKIADKWLEKDARVRVIHRATGNIGSGRNAGLDASTGSYIAFVDDDDRCVPDYLQFLYELAESSGADAAICGATWADIDERKIMDAQQATELLLWRKHYNVAFPTKLLRRELFENNRFLDTSRFDDIYLMPRVLTSAERVAYHGVSKYHFYRHDSNNSAWTQNHSLLDRETLLEYLAVYDERTKFLCEKFPDGADKWRYFNRSFMLSMVEKVIRLEIADCFDIAERLKQELSNCRGEFSGCGFLYEFERDWLDLYIK